MNETRRENHQIEERGRRIARESFAKLCYLNVADESRLAWLAFNISDGRGTDIFAACMAFSKLRAMV